MKILLLGGTGAMGRHLSIILSERGDNVIITSRKNRVSKGLIEYRQGNAKEILFLNTLLQEEWDIIVDFMIYIEDEFKDRIAKLLSTTSQYIFLSSARVYNESQKPLKEEFPRLVDTCTDKAYLATNEYALLKARQEDILKSENQKNWTIIRPYITYSEIRLQLGTLEKEDWLYRALKGRTIVFSEDIKNHVTTLTYSLDVANAIVSVMKKADSLGQAYHITSNYSYKWDDILEFYLDVLEEELGTRPKVIFQDLSEYASWNYGKYQIVFDRLFDRRFNNTKINQFINTDKFVKAEDGIRRCLKTFFKHPEFNVINWKNEAIQDRYTKERTPLKEINGLKQKVKYLLFRYFL